MEQLIEMVLQALRAAGIHCVRALDEETLPRLKAPMVAVGADPSACRQHALARYLGQDADGAERYGMELQATLQLEVYSPGRRAGALCERAAAQVVDVFLGDLELGRTAYDARTDCFRCAVRAPLTLRLYTTAQDGAFTHADIRGVLQ